MGFFAVLSSTMSKNPVLGPFAETLKTPGGFWTGLVGAASTIPGILISLPASSLSDVLGRRKFLLIAGFVFASAPFLYLLINVWWQLILVRFYHGFATAIFVPVAEASMAQLFPTSRGERISLFTSATYVGRAAAPFIGGVILFTTMSNDPFYNYHMLYLSVGIAGITALIMGLLFLAEAKRPVGVHQGNVKQVLKELYGRWGIIIRSRGVLLVSFIQASVYYTYGAVEFYLLTYLKTYLNLDWISTSAVSGGLIILSVFVRPYVGRISDRMGRKTPIVIGLIICSLPLLAIPFVSDILILLLLAIVYGVGFATVTASTPALITEFVPTEYLGASTGFLDTTMDIGQTIGPIISGFILASSFQYIGLFASLSFVLIFSCTVFVISNIASRRLSKNTQPSHRIFLSS
jgi:MFS family permease